MQCLEPCVERPFSRIDGINCRPELGAKLLNRGFHRSLAGLRTVSNATHRFFRFAPGKGTYLPTLELLPPPTLGERRHRGLVRQLVAVRRPAIFVVCQ